MKKRLFIMFLLSVFAFSSLPLAPILSNQVYASTKSKAKKVPYYMKKNKKKLNFNFDLKNYRLKFKDVPKDYKYIDSIKKAAKNQIIDNTATNFKPNDIADYGFLLEVFYKARLWAYYDYNDIESVMKKWQNRIDNDDLYYSKGFSSPEEQMRISNKSKYYVPAVSVFLEYEMFFCPLLTFQYGDKINKKYSKDTFVASFSPKRAVNNAMMFWFTGAGARPVGGRRMPTPDAWDREAFDGSHSNMLRKIPYVATSKHYPEAKIQTNPRKDSRIYEKLYNRKIIWTSISGVIIEQMAGLLPDDLKAEKVDFNKKVTKGELIHRLITVVEYHNKLGADFSYDYRIS